ncbi:hypothetical protein MKZ38_001121 [Zalerion maritima]|uniref:Uncharacterized protein n=1 Tax=Zalerion maritima TaxID=339359 RepID=A0AAD5WU03_9PEZI|nr:hypothetical protein MKZ38_001121 [Zalerion maritima]
MKALAILLLAALVASTPVVLRDDAIGVLIPCSAVLKCPLDMDCVPIDAACTKSCPGYCFPTGPSFPTGTLPTATLITNIDLPTSTFSTATLPTTNLKARATMDPRKLVSVVPRDEEGGGDSGSIDVEEGDDAEEEATGDGGDDEDDHIPPPTSSLSSPSTSVASSPNATLCPLPPPSPSYSPEVIKEWGALLCKYKSCGSFRPYPNPPCPKDHECISAPWGPACGLACDGPGICVAPKMCGGIAGLQCQGEGEICLDWPDDGCDPEASGRDCAGICL